MQNNSNRQNEDIRKILDKISGKNTSPKFSSSDVEFEIGVQESSCDFEEAKPLVSVSEGVEDAELMKSEETQAPSIFDIAEAEEGVSLSDEVFKINTVYIPRFTDASDDYRRLGYVPEQSKKCDAQKADVSQPKDAIDATAEIDAELSPDAKIVEVSTEEKELIEDGTSMVFKFEVEDDAAEIHDEINPEDTSAEEPKEEAPIQQTQEEPTAQSNHPSEDGIAEQKSFEEPIIIDEPLVKKLPEKYIPTNIAPRERVGKIGDELDESLKREFKSDEKRDSFKDNFLDKLMSKKLRLAVAALLSLALLIFENLRIFGVDLISLFHFDAVPEALALIDLEAVICISLFALPELAMAIKSAFSKKFTSELLVFPSLAVYIFYTVSVMLIKPSEYPLFGIVMVYFPLSAIVSAIYRTSADFTAFKIVSSADEKQIVDAKYTRALEAENMALDGLIEEYKSKTARVWKTGFVAGFFKRSGKTKERGLHLLIMLAASVGIALVLGLVTFFVYDGFISFVTSFALLFLFALPSVSILANKLPFFHASLMAERERGAVIGEASFYDYAGVDVVAFEDTEAFDAEDVNIQRIMLYGNNENLTKALSQMSALFSNIGGPLDIIFSDSQDRRPEPANGISIYDNGIIGEIDGKKIMAGTYDFMLSEGAVVPDEDEGGKKSHDSTKIMYAAENGTVYAKFYIRYRFSEEFTMLIPSLKDEGIIPLIYTRDPNINNELLRSLTAGIGVIRALKKYTTPARDTSQPKVSAGMVSNGDKASLINLITLSKRYVKFAGFIKLFERAALAAGALIAVIIALLDKTNIPSLPILIWQMACSAALMASSLKFFGVPRVKRKKKEKEINAE